MATTNQVAPLQLDITRGSWSGGEAALLPDAYAVKMLSFTIMVVIE